MKADKYFPKSRETCCLVQRTFRQDQGLCPPFFETEVLRDYYIGGLQGRASGCDRTVFGICCGRSFVYPRPGLVLAADAWPSRLRIPGSRKDYPIPSRRSSSLHRWLGKVLGKRRVHFSKRIASDDGRLRRCTEAHPRVREHFETRVDPESIGLR